MKQTNLEQLENMYQHKIFSLPILVAINDEEIEPKIDDITYKFHFNMLLICKLYKEEDKWMRNTGTLPKELVNFIVTLKSTS